MSAVSEFTKAMCKTPRLDGSTVILRLGNPRCKPAPWHQAVVSKSNGVWCVSAIQLTRLKVFARLNFIDALASAYYYCDTFTMPAEALAGLLVCMAVAGGLATNAQYAPARGECGRKTVSLKKNASEYRG